MKKKLIIFFTITILHAILNKIVTLIAFAGDIYAGRDYGIPIIGVITHITHFIFYPPFTSYLFNKNIPEWILFLICGSYFTTILLFFIFIIKKILLGSRKTK